MYFRERMTLSASEQCFQCDISIGKVVWWISLMTDLLCVVLICIWLPMLSYSFDLPASNYEKYLYSWKIDIYKNDIWSIMAVIWQISVSQHKTLNQWRSNVGQCLRRLINIKPTLAQGLVFVGYRSGCTGNGHYYKRPKAHDATGGSNVHIRTNDSLPVNKGG